MSIFSTLAFFIPLPLFFDIASQSLILEPVESANVLLLGSGIPVPIGLPAFMVIIVLSLKPLVGFRVNKAIPVTLFFLAVFVFIAIHRVELFKLAAVILPVLFLLAFSITISDLRIAEKVANGYIFGVLFQVYIHFFSMVLGGLDLLSLYEAGRSIFGFEIYQALISYSAFISFAGGAGLIFALSSQNFFVGFKILIVLCPFYLIVASLGRKAALVDLLLLFVLNIFLVIRSLVASRVPVFGRRSFFGYFFIFIMLFMFYIFFDLSPREITLDHAISQRSYSYEIFMDAIPDLTLLEILTGYVSGWGGFSNFIVELMARSGLVGTAAYLLAISFAIRRFYRSLFVYSSRRSLYIRGDIYVKSFFVFACLSFLVANLVNLSLQLPYYTLNLMMICVCFVFYYSRFILGRTNALDVESA